MPFDLPEYEDAYLSFLSRVTNGFVAADPLLGGIKEEPTTGTVAHKHFAPDGSEVNRPSRPITLEHTVEWQPLVDGHLDSFTTAVALGADGFIAQMKRMLFEELDVITGLTGNRVEKKGDLTWDDALEMMALVEWSPDDNGVVRPPDTIVVHPDTAAKMGPPTEAYMQGMKRLQEEKQREYDARRRRRRLP